MDGNSSAFVASAAAGVVVLVPDVGVGVLVPFVGAVPPPLDEELFVGGASLDFVTMLMINPTNAPRNNKMSTVSLCAEAHRMGSPIQNALGNPNIV